MAVDRTFIENLYSQDSIQLIWEKGIIVNGYDKDIYRKDFAGAWIARDAFGETNRVYGWQIDHVFPVSKGGDNHLINLRPMNWRNNVSKGDDYPDYIASVVSNDKRNIMKYTNCIVNSLLQKELSELYDI